MPPDSQRIITVYIKLKKKQKKLIISLISAILNKKVNLQKCKYS